MDLLIGLDPGGKRNFGWCIVAHRVHMPSRPIASGLADNASEAIVAALCCVPHDGRLVAAGIDAPLFWSRKGPRIADKRVRDAIHRAGAPHASGTVQDVNSLRGACLVQGMLAGLELRERFPSLPITEAHPKALRWLLPAVAGISASSEHERDAMLAAIAAWATLAHPAGWTDLLQQEAAPYSPLHAPLAYVMPGIPLFGAKQHD